MEIEKVRTKIDYYIKDGDREYYVEKFVEDQVSYRVQELWMYEEDGEDRTSIREVKSLPVKVKLIEALEKSKQ